MIDRIQVRPDVHFGKPCVAGTRIPVQAVLELVENGASFQTIISDYYPDLNEKDVRACVHYAVALIEAEDIHPIAAGA
jgi:uncharacterized protein (DUF433 family)